MNESRKHRAEAAADWIKAAYTTNPHYKPEIGIILGTGWGDAINIDKALSLPFGSIPGFSDLASLPGHARELICGELAGHQVAVLNGRLHMNEVPCASGWPKMVRLQVEMLCQLGVKKFIVSCAAGKLNNDIEVGDIVVLDGFITVFAPEMPLWAGEFCSPEDVLSDELRHIAFQEKGDISLKKAGYAMLRGPFFEGRKYDKRFLTASGAGVVGMSMLPEACIISLYGAEMLGLAFVTNDSTSVHSHEENTARVKAVSEKLSSYLTRLVAKIGSPD
ncbi:MAG: purine-nucleoside phosphorylase [Patescibacteria group bacterium]